MTITINASKDARSVSDLSFGSDFLLRSCEKLRNFYFISSRGPCS